MPAAGEGGRGFGLFGIRERLEFMGGTLEIESTSGPRESVCAVRAGCSYRTVNEPTLQGTPRVAGSAVDCIPNIPIRDGRFG